MNNAPSVYSPELLVWLCSIVIPLSACGSGVDPSTTYTVSGTVRGLTGTGVTLSDGSDTIEIPAGATSFTLPAAFHAGDTYAVTIRTQEASRDETCTLESASGTVHAENVSTIALVCAPTQWGITTIAGVAHSTDDSYDLRDGPGAQAYFWLPQDLVAASDGTIYVAGTDTIRVIANDDQHHVTTLVAEPDTEAPPTGRIGPMYRTPSSEIDGIALDAAGKLYFSDGDSYQVFTLTPGAGVASIAGSAHQDGTADGQGANARFFQPRGVALGADGNLRVADLYNNTIRQVTPGGEVTTIAGVPKVSGLVDGPEATAKFWLPTALAQDASGNTYVVDYDNNAIRAISPDGTVSTLAGGTAGHADGVGRAASFDQPNSIAVDPMGNLFVADLANHALRKISAGAVVTTVLQYDATEGIVNVSAQPDGSLVAITQNLQIVRIAPQ